jgi:hypothetical protein
MAPAAKARAYGKMKMGKHPIDTPQENGSYEKTHCGWKPDRNISAFRQFNGRSKQGPVAGSNHHAPPKPSIVSSTLLLTSLAANTVTAPRAVTDQVILLPQEPV